MSMEFIPQLGKEKMSPHPVRCLDSNLGAGGSRKSSPRRRRVPPRRNRRLVSLQRLPLGTFKPPPGPIPSFPRADRPISHPATASENSRETSPSTPLPAGRPWPSSHRVDPNSRSSWSCSPPRNVQRTFSASCSSPAGLSSKEVASGWSPQENNSPSCSTAGPKGNRRGEEGTLGDTSGFGLRRGGAARRAVAVAVCTAADEQGLGRGCRSRPARVVGLGAATFLEAAGKRSGAEVPQQYQQQTTPVLNISEGRLIGEVNQALQKRRWRQPDALLAIF
ncbi:uncharacterized protein LOC132538664 [Erinaceus europaeus]|uniref:Uncharacterized protein LOC132538664 n=1 Tax=Erinaceus europaeus TaxID=9365 RepID=A0ABM3XGA8_ERIEU|nr:uncharacterized protein LOC132538664 [Erinaceus europaeus]